MSEKQAASSVGQVLLINAWKKAFLKYKKQCGQILLTHLDAEIRSSAINARNTIETLLKLNSIPIINENDTVATDELKFGDNDRLAARVAQIVEADLLLLLTDVEGLLNKNPKLANASVYFIHLTLSLRLINCFSHSCGICFSQTYSSCIFLIKLLKV